jgi:hypothetical protein
MLSKIRFSESYFGQECGITIEFEQQDNERFEALCKRVYRS